MQRLLHTLHNRLFSRQHYLQTREQVQTPEIKKTGKVDWVLARSLCHYRLFTLTDIPANRRDKVLHGLIQRWTPFADYGCYVVWQQTNAQVWIWDKAILETALTQHQLALTIRVIPETLLHAKPTTVGLYYLQCLEGVEAQIWSAQHCLLASHWWPNKPNLTQWQTFLRQQTLPSTTSIPECMAVSMLSKPWANSRTAISWQYQLIQEPTLVAVIGLIFLGIASWEMTRLWLWQDASAQLQAEIAVLEQQSGPILQARNQAIAHQQVSLQLQDLYAYPSQLTLLAQVSQLLDNNALLVEWFYQTDTLQLTLEGDQLDPRHYIQIFQASLLFDKVQTEPAKQTQQLVLSMQVIKK